MRPLPIILILAAGCSFPSGLDVNLSADECPNPPPVWDVRTIEADSVGTRGTIPPWCPYIVIEQDGRRTLHVPTEGPPR